ncbi:DUF2161 family putative PD-(D/E)XK-type phosphodiesterase [Mesorhizobium sp. SB112]|uniref:DUF2161 family putative PD-(D/E)XK-type phosphodiesterase n=1 Tax=Mesorhizobium sp. SB112 TaxID=3151853 RepID=UPI003267BF44
MPRRFGASDRPRDLNSSTPKILQRNVYGWFHRADREICNLADVGREALICWPQLHLVSAGVE